MGMFDRIFKKKRPEKTPGTYMQEALARRGIQATPEEIEEVMDQAQKLVKFEFCFPELLGNSDSAELECNGPNSYTCHLSMSLMDGTGNIPDTTITTVISLAVLYITASKMATKKGFQEYVLKKGDRIALCDIRPGEGHPIYTLFPDLINKTILH